LIVEALDIISTLARQFAPRIPLHTKKNNKKWCRGGPLLGNQSRHMGFGAAKYSKQGPVKTAIGWSDSDWAGCLETRKSTTSRALMLGSHVI